MARVAWISSEVKSSSVWSTFVGVPTSTAMSYSFIRTVRQRLGTATAFSSVALTLAYGDCRCTRREATGISSC